MALVVNERDKALQTAVPRIEQVGFPSNVTIDPSNVDGLQATFDATKEVRLSTTSQVFLIPKVGAVQPAVIEITALLKSITGTPTFSVVDGAVSFTNQGNKILIGSSNLSSSTATIKVSVLFNSVTYEDQITIAKIAEGSDAVVGLLSNESCTVAATDAGVVAQSVLMASGGTFTVFDGIINKTNTPSVTYSVLNEVGVDVSINATTGVYTVNSMSALNGSATFRAVYTREAGKVITIDKVYTIAKAIAGVVGSDAKLLYLSATSQIFQIPKNGATIPTTITLTATPQNLGVGTPTWTTTPVMTLGGSTWVKTLDYGNMTADTVKIEVSHDGLSDTITIVKVREGNDSILGYLTNEASLVPSDSSGVVSSFQTAGGTFEVYQGLTRKTGSGITYSVYSETGIDVSIDATTGVYSVNSMSTDAGNAVLRATCTFVTPNVVIDKTFTLAKSRRGADGTTVQGSRGTVNISAAITGSTWTDAAANSALSTAGYGLPQSRDIVTLYNNSANFSQSKFYNGSGWATLDAYINGNLLVSRTVASAAIATGAIQAEHIAVSSGGNLLFNSGPNPRSNFYWYQWSGNLTNATMSAIIVGDTNSKTYCPAGHSGSVYIFASGLANANAGKFFDFGNRPADSAYTLYPIKGGQTYQFSGYVSSHRCRTRACIAWYNTSGVQISEKSDAPLFWSAPANGVAQKDFNRPFVIAKAPDNAAMAIVFFRNYIVTQADNGAPVNDAFCFVSMAMFSEAAPNQTVPSPWTEGGTTTISPGQIATGNLSAISANLGYVTAGEIHGGYFHQGAYGSAYAWPANGAGGGVHIGPGGILMGNPNQPGMGYFQIEAGTGNIAVGRNVPGIGIQEYLRLNSSGLTITGDGYFTGTLRANIVDTGQLVDRSVSTGGLVNYYIPSTYLQTHTTGINCQNQSYVIVAGYPMAGNNFFGSVEMCVSTYNKTGEQSPSNGGNFNGVLAWMPMQQPAGAFSQFPALNLVMEGGSYFLCIWVYNGSQPATWFRSQVMIFKK